MKHFYAAFLACLLTCMLASLPSSAQVDCSNERYKEKVFEELDIISNILYAVKQKSNGQWQNLYYDVYMPAGDTASLRPAVMLAHGGGFIDLLDQTSPDIVKLAKDLARRGYVVVSVDYREEPSVLSLFDDKSMIQAVGRALIDIRDVTCKLMDTTLLHGNPYRVDVDQVIVGGVSAGAVSFLQAVFLDSLAWLPPQFQEWILEVEPNTQALLDNKYCGATVKGIINISGAVLDTSWIKEYNAETYPAMMHVHGGIDPIVPFEHDYPFGITSLPKLMGSGLIDDRAQTLGMRSELDFYPNQGHAPIIGFNLEALFSGNPGDALFNPYILNRTLNHMAEFCYSLLDCDASIPTAVIDGEQFPVAVYPNPSRDLMVVEMSAGYQPATRVQVINGLGQVVFQEAIPHGASQFQVQHSLPSGLYHVVVLDDQQMRLGQTALVVQR